MRQRHSQTTILKDLREQIARWGRFLLIAYAPFFLLLGGIWLIGTHTRFRVPIFLRDPTAVVGVPFFVGIVSNLGVLFWAMGAFICLFSFVLLRAASADREWTNFFRFAGILTLLLLLDDFFLFHEEIFAEYLFPKDGWLHLNEKVIYVAYLAAIVRFLTRYRRAILQTDWLFLALGIAFLGGAIVADRGIFKYLLPDKQLRVLVEDGSKLLGIFGWALYFSITAKSVVLQQLLRRGPHPDVNP